MTKRNFGKDYKTPRELVTLLENRGLIINDRQKAQLYLESIGYYRLSAYMHPLLKTPKILLLTAIEIPSSVETIGILIWLSLPVWPLFRRS